MAHVARALNRRCCATRKPIRLCRKRTLYARCGRSDDPWWDLRVSCCEGSPAGPSHGGKRIKAVNAKERW